MGGTPSRFSIVLAAAALASVFAAVQCAEDTSKLTPEQEARFQKEGILRRADNIVFHYTTEHSFRREETRQRRVASIVVTKRSVLIHKNAKIGLEITDRSRRPCEVHRRGTRVRIYARSGTRSGEIWSFEPSTDAEGWTRDIRAVIRGGAGPGSPARRGKSRTSPG
jgi:hypothetical protein